MAVFTSQPNSIPILSAVTSPLRACLSLLTPADRPSTATSRSDGDGRRPIFRPPPDEQRITPEFP